MSDVNLNDLRRDYRFRLTLEQRCENCRHAKVVARFSTTGRCALLDIHIENVRKSVCPGWQTGWALENP